ncbi:MAG TPA: hypothetical protein QF549_03840 [Candidatus Saccharimonadaceae bacterium]|nr:hypothetical protein [Candidatus Saccharimonadaceae bacterium]
MDKYQHLVRARAKALIANSEIQRLRKEEIINRAELVVKMTDPSDALKIQLAILYKGEGAKYGAYRGLSLGSSDASILRLYIALLMIAYGKQLALFKARIQHRSDQDPGVLKAYWSQQLGFSENQFYKSYSDKRTKGSPTKKIEYKGVCVISCSGADIQLELEAIVQKYTQKVWGYSSAD